MVVTASDVVVDRIEVETVVEYVAVELDSPDAVVDVRLVESIVELLDSVTVEVEMLSVAEVLDSPDVFESVASDVVVDTANVETVVESVAMVLDSLGAVVEELNPEPGRHKPAYAPMGESVASSVITPNAFMIACVMPERTPP